jgi:hypothetical protein
LRHLPHSPRPARLALQTLVACIACAALGGVTLARAPAPQRKLPILKTASLGTDKAVLDGLRWLIRHQNPDGSWGGAALAERCMPDKPCFDAKFKYTDHYDEGLTAMALLCFLRAGFGDESKQDIVDTTTKKRHHMGEVVTNGLQWLVKRQQADGSFGKERAFLYNEALCALALTEAYAQKRKALWKEPAQKSIDFLQNAQRPNPSGKGLWGWRYASRADVEKIRSKLSEDDFFSELHDSDTSVTGWAVRALASAKSSGLSVSKEAMAGAADFCNWVTPRDGNGLVGYIDPKGAGAALTGPNDAGFAYHVTTMSAVAMCIRIFVDGDRKDPFLEQAAERIVQDLPTRVIDVSKPSPVDYYYWYYASLALSQFDGPESPKRNAKYWAPWKKVILDCVTGLQDEAEGVCSNGGWIVPDRWNYAGGPIYCTAINVLTLEGMMH